MITHLRSSVCRVSPVNTVRPHRWNGVAVLPGQAYKTDRTAGWVVVAGPSRPMTTARSSFASSSRVCAASAGAMIVFMCQEALVVLREGACRDAHIVEERRVRGEVGGNESQKRRDRVGCAPCSADLIRVGVLEGHA